MRRFESAASSSPECARCGTLRTDSSLLLAAATLLELDRTMPRELVAIGLAL